MAVKFIWRASLLPVDYCLVTFTLTRELHGLLWLRQRIGYDLPLKLGWETFCSFGLRDGKLAGRIGAHAVLRINSQRLEYRPHARFMIPAGTLDPKQRLWGRKAGRFWFW